MNTRNPDSAKNNMYERKRARDLGIVNGILPTGKFNAITDVAGVKVGHCTVISGPDIRTGITAVLPHPGDLYRHKVPGAIYSGNGFGKLIGYTQVEELGVIETPILLTNTLSAPRVADGLIEYMLSRPGNEAIKSINPVVAETNDGLLNDIRRRIMGVEEVTAAIDSARSGPVDEGCVGAGTGTVCFGFKGGVGTSSRMLPGDDGGHTVGVLVQTNFGGILQVNGAPVGRELIHNYAQSGAQKTPEGSCVIVVATDATVQSRDLKRLAKRAILGLARTGSVCASASGDYAIAFSTAESFADRSRDNWLSPLFLATVEATEEAIYNSLFMAVSIRGFNDNYVEAIPLDRVVEICGKYNALNWDERFPAA